MNIKKIFTCVLVLLVVCITVSCGEHVSSRVIINEVLEKCNLPPVIVRYSDAAEDEEGYIDYGFLAAVFGVNGDFPELQLLSEVSFFVSSSSKNVCEVGVFIVNSVNDTGMIADRCNARGKQLERAARGGIIEADAAKYHVITKGRYIIFIAGKDSESIRVVIEGLI